MARTADYYSPLPVMAELARHRTRWDRPSPMVGVTYDLELLKRRLADLVSRYRNELGELPDYDTSKELGYGPGFTRHDTLFLYLMLRDTKPRVFIEVGSGLSTFWASIALERNAREGKPCRMVAIDPYAREKVRAISGLEVLKKEVQDVEPSFFEALGPGDVLFIDSTHVVKLDGDVPHLYLEIVPSLREGVLVHAHDIHFPYNVPYPVQQNVFDSKWPRLWTEAMLLQAFLAFNRDFEIVFSPPLIRHHNEDFLRRHIPGYEPVVASDFDTHFGSIWFRRQPHALLSET